MHTVIITFMKICQSCFFTPAKSPFFVMIFIMFTQNPMGNLFFHVTSFTTLLCRSINIHGSDFILIWSLFLWNWMTSSIACFPSWLPLKILTILSLSLLPSNIHHNVSPTFFLILYQTNELFVGAHSRETYWIVWNSFMFLMEAH